MVGEEWWRVLGFVKISLPATDAVSTASELSSH